MAKYAPKVKTVIVEVDLYGSLGSGLGRIDDDATQSSYVIKKLPINPIDF